MNYPRALNIERIVLTVADLERSCAFYRALGFVPISPTQLRLGGRTIELRPGSGSYPSPRAANDPWFQHFAIAVSDPDAAFACLTDLNYSPISIGGPQLLPPNTGSVTAYKFRDPDGHPLEFFYRPNRSRLGALDPVFLGIDHTALAVANLEASLDFYTGLGFTEFGRSLNTGPEQDRLDGLDGVAVEIVALHLPLDGLHLELLHYRVPAPVAARPVGGIAATRTVMRVEDSPRTLLDPDGHRLDLVD